MIKKFVLIFLFPAFLFGQVYLTKEQALKLYFPNATVERKTVFLTDQQVEKIQTQAKSKVESKLVTYYVGKGASGAEGYAFFETHVVRTLPETFMVVLEADGSIRAVEILAFYEPEDYLPPKRWLALFQKKNVQSDLWLKRGVQNIVGATLSAQGITEGVRKVLATFETAIPKEK
ncbi:MAG: FMN-binding protein [Ignavibacteriales bacterium]|nr:FMN-binding protein [Ignavibacteriales bacterium]